jgi:nucleotide-binding universal stress UspA family protein
VTTSGEVVSLSAPIHPVIVGYDGSGPSRNALAYASGLARNVGRPLLMIYVVPFFGCLDPLGSAVPGTVGSEELERWLRSELDQVTAGREMEVHVCALYGDPARELKTAAVEYSADALVIGSSGRFRGYFTGTLEARLVKRARCPVIVVP